MMAACPSQMSIFAFPLKSKYSAEISKSEIRTSTAVPPPATKLQILNSLKLSPGVYGVPLKCLSCLMAYANQRFKLRMAGCVSTIFFTVYGINSLQLHQPTAVFKSGCIPQFGIYHRRRYTGTLSSPERVNQEAGDGETPFRNDPRL